MCMRQTPQLAPKIVLIHHNHVWRHINQNEWVNAKEMTTSITREPENVDEQLRPVGGVLHTSPYPADVTAWIGFINVTLKQAILFNVEDLFEDIFHSFSDRRESPRETRVL